MGKWGWFGVLLAAAVIVVAALQLGGRGAGPRVPGAASGAEGAPREFGDLALPAAEQRRAVLPEGGTEAREFGPSGNRGVHITSAVGIPLDRAEYRAEDTDWIPALEQHGALVAPLGMEVRAPGHRAALPREGEKTVALEPFTLLVLENQAWGTRVRSVEVVPHLRSIPKIAEGIRRSVSSGAVDDQSWAIAFDAKDLEPILGRSLDLKLDVEGDAHGWVHHWLEAARADHYRLPLERVPTNEASLSIHVESTRSDEGPVDISLWRSGPEILYDERTPWGRAYIRENVVLREERTRVGETLELRGLPTGTTLNLSGVQPSTGAFAKARVGVGERSVTLSLHSGWRVIGRVVVSGSRGGPGSVELKWRHAESGLEPDSGHDWSGEASTSVPSSEGHVEFFTPSRVPLNVDSGDAPPPWIHVEASAPGFESARVSTPIGDPPGPVDLGDLVMTRRTPDIVLLDCEQPRRGELILIAGFEGMFGFEIEAGLVLPGGELELFLERDEGADGQLSAYTLNQGYVAAEWPAEWPPSVVLSSQGTGIALRHRGDGRYELVPTAPLEWTVECRRERSPQDPTYVGWTWEGIDVIVWDFDLQNLGAETTIETRLPATGATLWWERRGERFEVPFSESTIRFAVD